MTAPSPWVVVDRSGFETVCAGRAEWLAEWRHRIRAIEAANRPVQRRREGLDRMLVANAAAFRALVKHGALESVIEITGAAAAADARLSWSNISAEIAA
jgi:hypothetical protein